MQSSSVLASLEFVAVLSAASTDSTTDCRNVTCCNHVL